MKIFKVCLFGHRDLSEHRTVEKRLVPILERLINENHFLQIYIGRNGEFDVFAASIAKGVQRRLGNHRMTLSLILPYICKDIEYYEKYYDDIIIPEIVEVTHPKGKITARNKWIIENSDLFICYVSQNHGGAYTALQYAKKLNKPIINLAYAPSFED